MIFEQFISYVDKVLLPRFTEILIIPWIYRNLLWLVIPLLFVTLFINLYFGRNKSEALGWNTAFANAISLFWITVLLIKTTLEQPGVIHLPLRVLFSGRYLQEFILISLLALWTILWAFFDYFHALPRKIAFVLSSATIINATAYVFISLILGDIVLDRHTLFAGILILLLFVIFFALFRSLVKPSLTAREVLEQRRHKKEFRKQLKRKVRREKIKEEINRTKLFLDKIKRKV